MDPVGVFAFFASNMALGKSGNTHAKLILFVDEADQLIGVFKASGSNFEVATAGRIAPQSEHVFHTQLVDLAEEISDLLFRGTNAGQMGHGGQSVLSLDAVHNHQGLVS